VVFEGRWADGRMDRLPALGGELVARAPAVIVAGSVSAAVAATNAAPMIPIVYVGVDPIAAGLARSLGRPGGMLTDVSNVRTFVSVKMPVTAALRRA
jgi:putative ABC transport system substrate-binding protein